MHMECGDDCCSKRKCQHTKDRMFDFILEAIERITENRTDEELIDSPKRSAISN